MTSTDDMQNTRMDNIEARLTALESIVIAVEANAKLLKIMALGLFAMIGINVQDFML